ncbi:hypothetical protein [Halomonas sp.]|jgi:hypothetical protein|uniref:hypothetical protein n=1 Tax=Halomonas sp. TaxID=1486246 RepID=UPI0035646D82
MTVRTFAFALLLLGFVFVIVGVLKAHPALFVGIVLIVLSGILLWTRNRRPGE